MNHDFRRIANSKNSMKIVAVEIVLIVLQMSISFYSATMRSSLG